MLPGLDAVPLRKDWLKLFRRAMVSTAFGESLLRLATAAAARTALGVGALGDALFLTTTAAAARTALGFTSAMVDRAYGEYLTNADITGVIPFDDTIPQNTEGTQIISVSLTPKTTTNRVRLRLRGAASNSGTALNITAAVFSSASANALVADWTTLPGASSGGGIVLEHEYVPGTTSALTFTVRVGNAAGTAFRMNGSPAGRVFGGVAKTTLVVEELTA